MTCLLNAYTVCTDLHCNTLQRFQKEWHFQRKMRSYTIHIYERISSSHVICLQTICLVCPANRTGLQNDTGGYTIFSNLSSFFTLRIDVISNAKKMPAPTKDPFATI